MAVSNAVSEVDIKKKNSLEQMNSYIIGPRLSLFQPEMFICRIVQSAFDTAVSIRPSRN